VQHHSNFASAREAGDKMIWLWAKALFLFMAKLIIPPPNSVSDFTIDRNEKCPACGHREGELRTIMDAKQTILVQHHCNVCGARWHEKTILGAKPGIITPAQVWVHGDERSSS
jgi:formate dehydrogenase maturation protein FdhE